MNRIAALVISTILLTQIASYSYEDIPSQIEWDEPLKGDPEWKVTGRNSSNCGSQYTETSISTSTNQTTYAHNSSPELVFIINCAMVGANYTLSYKVYHTNSSTQNYLAGVVNQSFVANAVNFTIYVNLGPMTYGHYSVNTSLRNTTYDSTSWISDYNGSGHNTSQFIVMMPQLPGIDVIVYSSYYNSNSTISIPIQAYNLNNSSNVSYLIQWEIRHWSNSSILSINGTQQNGSYYVSGSFNLTYLSVFPPDDGYIVSANITEVVISGGYTWYSWIGNDYALFTVGSSTNNTGNQTGNNTNVCGSDINRTDLSVWVDLSVYFVGDSVWGSHWPICEIGGENYTLESTLEGPNGIVDYNIWNWTANLSFPLQVEWDSLATGYYCINATLIMQPNTYINSSITCFNVLENNSGGNNTGGNNTGGNNTSLCGQDANLTELHISTDSDGTESSIFSVSDHIMGTFSISCGIDQEEYGVQSTLHGDNGIIRYDNWSWVGEDGIPMDESVDYMMLESGYYCINATLFGSNIYITTNSSCFTVVENFDIDEGIIIIEEIALSMMNQSGIDYSAVVEITNINTNWTAYWAIYEGVCSYYDLFGANSAWDYGSGWWSDPFGDCQIISDVGTSASTGQALGWDIPNLNSWATLHSDVCYTFAVTLFAGDLGPANGQTTPATSYPISFDSQVFGYHGCGANNTGGGELEWMDESVDLDQDCIEGPFYVNGTLSDLDNVTGGSTMFYYSIYHVDENEVETQTGMSYSTTVYFDENGSAEVSVLIDPTGYTDGQYYIHLHTTSSGDNLNQFYWFTLGCNICGYSASFISSSYEIWSDTFGTLFSNWNQTTNNSNSVNDDTPQIYQGDTLTAGMWFSCLVHGEDYLANLTVTNDANLVVHSEEESFTQNSWSSWYSFYADNVSTTDLPPGDYCLTLTLYVSPFGSSDIVFTITECVEIVSIDDWDGCGTNLTYLEHLQEVNGNPFVQQDTVFLTTSNIWYNNFVDCLVIGENYTMVTTVTHDGSIYMQETTNFTVDQFSDVTQWSWGSIANWGADIATGNYCVETTIHSTDVTHTNLIALVSSVTDCFAVVEITPVDWWGDQTNNTTGSPNNPVMPDTNCTNLSSSLSGLNLTNAFNLTDCENGTGFWFNLTVNGTGINWYDPVYAVGYDFEVLSGPKFASVVVPPGYGDDKYDIYLWDGSEYVLTASDLDALTQYWFTDDGQITTTPGTYDGITMFSIRGLELDAKLDPDDPNAFVTGLTFVQDPNEVSEVVLSMNPIRVSDEDDDGIADVDDNCVDDANTDQADADGDGIGDVCDNAGSGEPGDDGGTDDKPDSSTGSNKTLAYAALLAVALVGILVMFGREDER